MLEYRFGGLVLRLVCCSCAQAQIVPAMPVSFANQAAPPKGAAALNRQNSAGAHGKKLLQAALAQRLRLPDGVEFRPAAHGMAKMDSLSFRLVLPAAGEV